MDCALHACAELQRASCEAWRCSWPCQCRRRWSTAGLRLFQKQIQLAFMLRLSRHLHKLYCSNRSYYSASVLGGASPPLPLLKNHSVELMAS